MVKTDKYGRLPAKLEQDVKKWMSLHANEHENSTSLAEEAASIFGLYEDTVDYTIPEIVFELSLKACEDAGITESDDGETVHHGEHKKGVCDACKEYSPSLDSQGLCPECAHEIMGSDGDSIDEMNMDMMMSTESEELNEAISDRDKKLKSIWAKTHKDFRGTLSGDGKKTILINRDGKTTLVPLDQLTDKEIEDRLPKTTIESEDMKVDEDSMSYKSLEDEAWDIKISVMGMLSDFAKKCKDRSKQSTELQDKLDAQTLMRDANSATTMVAKEFFPSTHMDTISMSSIKTEGESKLVEADTTIDEHALEELELYMDNEYSIYNQKKSIIKNLQRKMKSGKYDHSLAPKLWAYWVEAGAKAYAKEFDSPTNWNKLFPKPLRDALAIKLADDERSKIESGEYDGMMEDNHVVSKGEDTADVLLDEAEGAAAGSIMDGMASALWATAWADHVEEHGCESLSGMQIEDAMPIVPEAADRMAAELVAEFESKNGKSIEELFKDAVAADETEGKSCAGEEESFGHDLAMQAMGHGVSWFDDHAEFPIKFPRNFDNFDLRIKADEDCEEDGNDMGMDDE